MTIHPPGGPLAGFNAWLASPMVLWSRSLVVSAAQYSAGHSRALFPAENFIFEITPIDPDGPSSQQRTNVQRSHSMQHAMQRTTSKMQRTADE